MSSNTVLLIGGYGLFGRHLAERLSAHRDLRLLIAGRRGARAEACCDALRDAGALAACEPLQLDASDPQLDHVIRHAGAALVVHTGGPFQGQDYRVAEACIRARAHYVDLADGRDFVAGIGELDAAAREAGVLVTSGASSVPALSAAAVDALARGMAQVDAIDIGISPGNRTERGLSTVRAILGYCGAGMPGWSAGRRSTTTGWLRPRRVRYPAPVGVRWLSDCDVPDMELLPSRFPDVQSVRFGAGLELRSLHFGMAVLAAMRRIGLVKDWSVHASWLKRMADRLQGFGSDDGAMHVQVDGRDAEGRAVRRRWVLLACTGHGPYVPTLAAAALVRRFLSGRLSQRGARPCMGLLDLDAFAAEADGLEITMERV